MVVEILNERVFEKSQTSYIDIIVSTPRNTAAAIAFAAFASDPEAVLIVTLLIILSVMLICMKNQCKKLLIKQRMALVTSSAVPTNQKQDTDTLKEMAITYFLSEKTKSSFGERFNTKETFME
jgi:hypothetical protein